MRSRNMIAKRLCLLCFMGSFRCKIHDLSGCQVHLHLAIILGARVFCEKIVNETQPSALTLIESEGEFKVGVHPILSEIL